MIKQIFIGFCFLSGLTAFSQEIVSTLPLNLKKNRDVFQTVNSDKKEVTLFISDKTNVKAIQFDEKTQVIDSMSAERPNTKTYTNMIGYNLSDKNTRLFWSSNDYKNILSQLYDFKSRKTETKEFSLNLKDEKVLQKFSENHFFYVLTVIKNSNNFKLYVFDNDGNYTEKVINLRSFTFYESNNYISDLYGVFRENLLPFEAPFSLELINSENPSSLTAAAKKRKCYQEDKKIIITLDTNSEFTQIITIDLKDFTTTEKRIKTSNIEEERIFVNSNSFYSKSRLYQIKSSPKLFYFTIKDLEGNLVKEYVATSTQPIDFKNSEVSQQGGEFGGKRVLENSSQFIRKLNNLKAGVTSYTTATNNVVTFGGVSAAQQTGLQAGLGQFGLIGALVSIAVYNPTLDSFNSYANRKVVKTEGLFDANGNHIKGDLEPLAFDKIRDFLEKNKDFSSQTLFKTDAYYLGYYDNKAKEYIIRKFID